MIRNPRTLSQRTAQKIMHIMKRTQGTSTMGDITSQRGPYGDHNSSIASNCSISRDSMGFSTAVAFGGNDHPFDQITAATHSFAQVQDMLVFGKELSMKAVAVAKSGEKLFDKIVLLVSHGEASCVTEEESRTGYGDKVEGDLALTKHGIGQALKMSSKTGEYCHTMTRLVPELFVVSPLRCATEAALLSFPYYSPGSIYGTKWVSHGACHDSNITSSVENLERSFPNIDYSLAEDQSDFLSWLNGREEQIVAISSTPSWIQDFCDSIETGHDTKDLRAVGIKFAQL